MLAVWLPLINGNRDNLGLINIGTATTSASIVAGKLGNCYQFTRTSHHQLIYTLPTELLNKINNHSFGVSAWVKSSSSDAGVWLSITYGIRFQCNSFSLYNSSRSVGATASSGTAADGNWHHVAYTYNVSTNKMTCYRDGVEVGSANYTSGYTYASSWTNNINIARDPNNSPDSYYFNGCIQDVRIWCDECPTTAQIKELSKGLVAHYTLGSADVLPAITNYVTNSGPSGWNNSGAASRNSNETTYGKPLFGQPVYSITTTTAGEQCITFGNLGSTNATTLRGKQITASCWIYIVGNSIYNSAPYLRSSKYDNAIVSFKYNGNGSIPQWPKNRWIRIEGTGTIASDETDAYFCNYLGNSGEIRAFSGWQVENYGIATPRIAPGTSRSTGIVYDSSGYCRNGVISGTISPADSVRYDKSIYMDGTSAINIGNVATYVPDGNLTVNLWFYKDSYSSKSYDTVFGGPSGFEIETKPHASNEPDRHICPHNWGTDHTANTEIPYEFNKWNMLTMVRTSSNSKWYLNGELKRTLNPATIPSGDYFIGAWRSATEQNFKGRVSDCRIFATALSADDVKDLYNLGASIS